MVWISSLLSQENNGGENENTEETLADPAEPKQEAKDSEETKPSEGEEKGEANANTKAADSLEPVNALETVKEEAEPTEAHNSDDKSDEPLISI